MLARKSTHLPHSSLSKNIFFFFKRKSYFFFFWGGEGLPKHLTRTENPNCVFKFKRTAYDMHIETSRSPCWRLIFQRLSEWPKQLTYKQVDTLTAWLTNMQVLPYSSMFLARCVSAWIAMKSYTSLDQHQHHHQHFWWTWTWFSPCCETQIIRD